MSGREWSDTTDKSWGDLGSFNDVLYNVDGDDGIGVIATDDWYGNIALLGFAADVTLENGVISTDTFIGNTETNLANQYGRGGSTINVYARYMGDAGSELDALYALGSVGAYSAEIEGMIEGGEFGGDTYTGETAVGSIVASRGTDIIANYSIGLGYMSLLTTYTTAGDYNLPGVAYFTYANDAITTPTWLFDSGDVTELSDATGVYRQYYQKAGSTWDLHEFERIGLNAKFGHNVTWTGLESMEIGESTSPLLMQLSSSMTEIVSNIVTSFPENILSFARSAPLRLRHSDIYAIETDELLEGASVTSDTVATPSRTGLIDTFTGADDY